MQPSLDEFLRWRSAMQACVCVELSFMVLCRGDPGAAMLLSHVVDIIQAGNLVDARVLERRTFWRMPWASVWTATRLPRKRRINALAKLKKLGFLRTKVLQDRGAKTTSMFVAIREEHFLNEWNRVLSGKVPTDEDAND